jgi:eukaryotic-like serine/threonine-protein kinase
MPVPNQIGRFAVVERIGGGAFASVWRAHDEALDAAVAIKVLSENWLDAMDVRRRFADEAKLLRRAESDRVVRVHDLGELDDGRPYLVMTYADRGTLAERLKPGPLPWRDAAAVTVEIALAVQRLHFSGVLHRDIKPSNVLFRSLPDGREQVLLGDLGLGKLLSEASLLTLAGGTPAFMAPEQARPGTTLSVRTDLYGLGALLYGALTGRNPYGSTTTADVANGSRPAPPAPSALVPDVPSELDSIVLRALAPRPEERQPDADAFVADLRQVLARHPQQRIPVRNPPAVQPPPSKPKTRTGRRRRWLATSVIAVLLVIGASGGAAYWFANEPQDADIIDKSGTVRLKVPREWAAQLTDSDWDPAMLGVIGPLQPAVLVAPAVAAYPNLADARPGMFVGVLPAGTKLNTTDFDGKVARANCLPDTVQPTTAAGVLTMKAQRCGDVIVQDVLLSRAEHLVWAQVKQPVTDTSHTSDVLASVTIAA